MNLGINNMVSPSWYSSGFLLCIDYFSCECVGGLGWEWIVGVCQTALKYNSCRTVSWGYSTLMDAGINFNRY